MSRRKYMQGNAAHSPIPYQQISYLENTDVQWIDTDIKYDSNNRYYIECNVTYTGNDTSGSPCNGWFSGGSFGLSGTNCSDGVNSNIIPNAIGLDLQISLEIQSGINTNTLTSIVYNGTTYSASREHSSLTTNAGNGSYMLFACYYQSGVVNSIKEKIYDVKIYVNDELVRRFIPVRIGQVGYMYDEVSGELFGNASIGNFTLGPDVVQL